MARKRRAQLQPDWVKIHIHLPINGTYEIIAANKSIAFALEKHGGCTYSTTRPHVFKGWWKNDSGEPVLDRICVLTIDIPCDFGSEGMDTIIKELHTVTKNNYERHNSGQDVIWINTYPIHKLEIT